MLCNLSLQSSNRLHLFLMQVASSARSWQFHIHIKAVAANQQHILPSDIMLLSNLISCHDVVRKVRNCTHISCLNTTAFSAIAGHVLLRLHILTMSQLILKVEAFGFTFVSTHAASLPPVFELFLIGLHWTIIASNIIFQINDSWRCTSMTTYTYLCLTWLR